MTSTMVKYETTFEATQNLIKTIEIGHGEAADLYTSITDCGVEVELSGFTINTLYQPKSKWGTDVYYACPSEIVDNKGIVHWSHINDTGDSAAKMWVSFQKDGKTAYPALYQIGFFATPGFNPSPIEPIKEILDFSQYTLLNAPWVLPNDLSVYATTASLSAYATKQFVETNYASNEALQNSLALVDAQKYMVSYINSSDLALNQHYKAYRTTLVSETTSYAIPLPDTSEIDGNNQYFDYELEVAVPSNATALTGPDDGDGWTWMEDGELPTDASDFAGKTIYIACRYDCETETTLANVWRIA